MLYPHNSSCHISNTDMDVAFRGAISIAGRLVDPLREMVKVPPASLGLGMYQHDLKEAVLSRRLGEVLQEIVSDYGVDLNMASEEVGGRRVDFPRHPFVFFCPHLLLLICHNSSVTRLDIICIYLLVFVMFCC